MTDEQRAKVVIIGVVAMIIVTSILFGVGK